MERLHRIWDELGLSRQVITDRQLTVFAEPAELVELQTPRRSFRLLPDTRAAWLAMVAEAARNGVHLLLLSAFRSYDYQAELIRKRLAKGEGMDACLQVLAPPGCSEHHTGSALDLGTPGCPPLSEGFADTDAFAWLRQNAARHGFSLSFPRDNPFGYIYEPWHWRHRPIQRVAKHTT
jgi:D-alanyl-D-alanine carboxypeptidase